ncbi:hypothetical protein ACUR5C_15800 [Aliikangiella sp. IMCC44653]
MKTWTPLIATSIVSLLLNAYPIFMASVVKAEGWLEAGWVWYYFSIPVTLVIFSVGLLTSVILYFARLGKTKTAPANSAGES